MSESGPSDEQTLQEMPEESGPSDEQTLQEMPEESGPTGPPPPPTLTLAEIMATQEVLAKLESDDRAKLEAIGQLSIDTLRPKLIAWAVAGFPNNWAIHEVSITPPTCCSDGVVRNLADYIVFCSGKSLSDHIAPLQTTLPDITVAFAYAGPTISVVVIKA